MEGLDKYPALMTLKEAADFLRVTTQTVVKYGKQGRITIRGSHNAQRVVKTSIRAYVEGKSPWHAKSSRATTAASEAPVVFATSQAVRNRGRQSGDTTMPRGNIVDFRADRKLRRG